jgi:hypothetical protein
MAITNENGGIPATMLVGPTSGMPYFAGNQNSGFGGDGGWWILLLFILLGAGNWGGNGWSGDGGVQRGFDQASVMNGFTGIQNTLNSGFSSVNAALNANQIADMQNSFAMQQQFSNCCCENRLATSQTQNIVQAEGAATRLAIQNQTQEILDKMCQQEIDALKTQVVSLQNQVNMQNLAASQVAQTAQLIADNTAQTQYIVNRVAPYPIPSYTVANPNTPATGA